MLPAKDWVECIRHIMISVFNYFFTQRYFYIRITLFKIRKKNIVKKQLSRLTLLKGQESSELTERSREPHQPVVVLGLELQGSDDVDSHDALLGPAVRQLPELPRRGWNSGILRQCIDLKRSLKIGQGLGQDKCTKVTLLSLFFLIYSYLHAMFYRGIAKLQPAPQ